MDIRVSGHQVDTGGALRTHVEERLRAISTKHFARAISANVTFGKGPHDAGFTCDIVCHVMQGLVLKGQDPRSNTLGAITVTYQPSTGTVQVVTGRTPPATATSYPALAVSFAAGDQLGARATAAGTVEVYRNGVRVGAVTLSAADQAYFGPRGGYIGLLYANASGATFDDFGGGSVGP